MSRREALITKFRAITGERVTKVRRGLLALEARPDDPAAASDVHHELHTLKGEAKLLGFVAIGGVALALEELFAVAEASAFRSPGGAEGLIGVGLDVIDDLRTRAADAPEARIALEGFTSRARDLVARAGTSLASTP